jgi:coenzyme F420-dependent glucose-6-phosphate dehydrogenase
VQLHGILTRFYPKCYTFISLIWYPSGMIQLGYALSSEEHDAQSLVNNAVKAEQAGFSFALISDHFHPWINTQGQSPFVWAVIGGISQKTKKLRLGTGVTCPIIRIHPAILAQAAATAGQLMEGRFFFGVGTGENLNEHVVGLGWPPIRVRQLMLKEAVQIIRLLWEGENTSFYGEYFTVEDARIYSLPDTLPDILVAASGPQSAILAGEIGDGYIGTSPQKEIVRQFTESPGIPKPTYGQITVCVAKSEKEALDLTMKWWPNSAIPGQFSQEARVPAYFQQMAKMVTPDHIKTQYVLGSDPQAHLKEIQKYADAGFDHIYIHQIGPNQDLFFKFYEKEILPKLTKRTVGLPKRGRGRPRKNSHVITGHLPAM